VYLVAYKPNTEDCFGKEGPVEKPEAPPCICDKPEPVSGITTMRTVLQTEGVRIMKTKTDPSYAYAIEDMKGGPPCRSGPSTYTDNAGYFAPVETTIFRTILTEQCKQKDKNGNPPLVIDVGANNGYFTLYAAKLGCRVVAFEPYPRLVQFLQMSIMVNGFEDLVQLYPYAVSNSSGTIWVIPHCAELGFTKVTDTNSGGGISAKKVTLSEIVKEDALLLKIDVEGYEHMVYAGMKDYLTKYKIVNVICETKKNDEDEKKDMINAFIASGYKTFSYRELYDQGSPVNQNTPKNSFVPVTTLPKQNSGAWIPYEDLYYSKQFDEMKWS